MENHMHPGAGGGGWRGGGQHGRGGGRGGGQHGRGGGRGDAQCGGHGRGRHLVAARAGKFKRAAFLPSDHLIVAAEAAVTNIPYEVLEMFLPAASSHMRRTFVNYIRSLTPIQQMQVPGDTRLYDQSSVVALNSTGASVDWVVELHRAGFSLDGVMGVNDFVVDHRGLLKGSHVLRKMLKPLDDTRRDRDLVALAGSIQDGIYHGITELPRDVAQLVRRLKRFKRGYHRLYRMHVATKSEIEKCAMFERYFVRLEQIRQRSPGTYAKIIKRIDCGLNWLKSSMLNLHVHSVMRFRPGGSTFEAKLRSFLSVAAAKRVDVPGFLTTRRNGQAHLSKDNAMDLGQGKEIALKAATSAMIQENPSIAVMLGKRVQNTPGRGTAIDAKDAAFTPEVGGLIAKAICNALSIGYIADKVAAKAAKAAAKRMALYVPVQTTNKAIIKRSKANAHIIAANAARAAAVAQVLKEQKPHGPLQTRPVLEMFTQTQIEHMFYVIAPDMLHSLQLALFREGILEDGHWLDESKMILLLDPPST
ncbi:hypothetical protein CFC21_103214 [Triticum aestivum]|uniref:Uncharacterized protein n=2 Tax=Triticum aestivum TaxID=4565 RepID=A0A3B6SKL4_WHEAT|nr:uncharacterized protein LOC123160466 [Triticum aestivum]KAF7102021.1 hypothetical protein CFC21_103214 [Triticum aestivum]